MAYELTILVDREQGRVGYLVVDPVEEQRNVLRSGQLSGFLLFKIYI
jgi:hypothetical protein